MSELKGPRPQLVADLSVFTAADAIQWACTAQFSGRMAFRGEGRLSLYMKHGGIVHAASSRRIEAIGQHLFSEGLVDEIDLAAAIVHSRDSQVRIGDSMIALGLIDEATLERALYDHVVNLATLPVTWTAGWVQAGAEPLEESSIVLPEAVDATFVLMEASRRADELKTLPEALSGKQGLLSRGPADLPESAPDRWRRILMKHAADLTVRKHYEQIGGSWYRFVEAVQELVAADVLRLGTASGSGEPALAQTVASS